MLLQDHESKQLRVERHSLKVGLDASGMTINKLENEVAMLKQQLKEQQNFEHFNTSNFSNDAAEQNNQMV